MGQFQSGKVKSTKTKSTEAKENESQKECPTFYGIFVTKERAIINGLANGSCKFMHKNFIIEGEFIDNVLVSIDNISDRDGYFHFIFDPPSRDNLVSFQELMQKKDVDHSSIRKLMAGDGTFTFLSDTYIKGHFVKGNISDGQINTCNYIFIGTIENNFNPLHGTLKFANLEYTGNCKMDSVPVGKITYKNGDVYEGICKIESKSIEKHGKGCLTTQNSRLIGSWTGDKLNYHLENKEEFNNGLTKEYVSPDKIKLKVKINILDFKLDMQHLSDFFRNPPQIQDEKQTYELIFDGIEKNNLPQRGDMSIRRVFKFMGGYWNDNYDLECQEAKLIDLVNRKEYSLRFVDGIELNEKNIVCDVAPADALADANSTIVTAEFHEEEGAIQPI